ncbi:endoribonuclease YBEY, chloroplastic isoform X2 [Manihot esculenta]|uniref:Uncharacterized protein n=1 Tax=Manihot esculenta TaxID=3983 RepID=A0ACB7G7T2_MANES|nr:endoribonuclease YBEY, chloroplastic isoform X2 [Manihot esculenta]KAG8635894.1 hypothetical protein MANES_16G073200v8 [Manihot esculenta]
MPPPLSRLLRTLHPLFPSSAPMARVFSRATSLPLSNPLLTTAFSSIHSSSSLSFTPKFNRFRVLWLSKHSAFGKNFHALSGEGDGRLLRPTGGRVWAAQRGYRKVRRRAVPKIREKGLELNVSICIEEKLPDDPEILSIAELLRLNVPMAMKLAFDDLKDSVHKTRDMAIRDVGGFESVELSVLLCNDEFIRELNKEWRDEDHATDVLSMSQHVPQLKLPILMLGDIVISVETAARQAEERGHTLIDEIRILLVHGLLHLLGFDHEISEEAEAEMEKEEELLLKSLGWKGKGLIQSAYDAETNVNLQTENLHDRKKEGCLRFYKPKFNYIFCDMDGTLLNSRSQISWTNAKALKEALSRGVKVVIATGKARPAAISILKKVELAGKDGVISELSPGVFLQGLLVYGRQGREIFRSNLDPSVCREACLYSLEHKVPLVAFSNDRCLTLFDHPIVDSLHAIYHEPKAEIMPSVEHLLAAADIQVMAIGDGENDIEMLELASLGIALSNGSEKTKAVADIIGASNDEDGVADAIYRYAF